jgi:hypothetical protein
MTMAEPISRRSAILRMFAALSTTKLFAWETAHESGALWSTLPTNIVPGERLGDLFLDMSKPEVVSRLGLPCETQHFKAEDLEETLKLYAYLNKMTGGNLSVDKNPPQPATSFLNYYRLGLSLVFTNDRISAIHAYTGVLSGYQSKSNFPTHLVPHGGALINTLDDVYSQFGKPDSEVSNEFAPIPEVALCYNTHGIAFDGRADDGRLAIIKVLKRRR